MPRHKLMITMPLFMVALTWWAWTPVGVRVQAQFTFLAGEQHGDHLASRLEQIDSVDRSSSQGNTLTVVSRRPDQDIVQLIKEGAEQLDRDLRRTQFEEEQRSALRPLHELEQAKAALTTVIEKELMLTPELFGGLEPTIDVLNFAEQTARLHLGDFLSRLPNDQEGPIVAFIREWLVIKDLEGTALTEALTHLNPPNAAWQAPRLKLEESPKSSSDRERILSLLSAAAKGIKQTHRTKMEMLFRPTWRPTLMSDKQREAFDHYKEALAAYEESHQQWLISPTKHPTAWVDLGSPRFIQWNGATATTIRRFNQWFRHTPFAKPEPLKDKRFPSSPRSPGA